MSTELTLTPIGVRGGRRPASWRYLFVALGVVYVAVAIAGFAPSYRAYLAGTRDIHWFAHVHGGLMGAWLALFVAQASLVAAGSVSLHRKLGLAGVALGATIWLSMCVTSVRVRVALDPPLDSFLWDVWLRELALSTIFLVFFVAAILKRRDAPTHQRLMTLATVVLLQAAIDRLPVLRELATHSPHFGWLYVGCLYVLIAPLMVLDLATLGRLHRATLAGLGITLAGSAVFIALAGRPWWHEFAYQLFNAQ
jgi:hypothetical protein